MPCVSGHVFISYSHRADSGYVGRLAAHFAAAGVEAWYDKEIVHGDRWTRAIREKIDTCSVFVVVMTPDAEQSEWVDIEISQARQMNRPILPLLLEGHRFFTLANVQYADVTGGVMPGVAFMTALRRLTSEPRKLDSLADGKVFRDVIHPTDLQIALQREASNRMAVLTDGRTLVPNRYFIELSPNDHGRFVPYAAALAQELAQAQADFIGEQGMTVVGDVIVEIERGDDLDSGLFRMSAEVYPTSPEPVGERNPHLVASDGRRYPLTVGQTVIGRGEQADIRLPDIGIARRHARFDFDGAQITLTDLGSTNGTMVNGRRISAIVLDPGDMIQLGTTMLTLHPLVG